MRIEISRDLPKRKTDFSWQKGISNCHAYLLHRKDVLKHIKLAHDELGFRYLRCHGIFDDTHCNPKRIWEEKGRPSNLRRSEVEEIMERSRLVEEEHPFVSGQGRTEVKVECRTNDVVLITVITKEQTKETVSL